MSAVRADVARRLSPPSSINHSAPPSFHTCFPQNKDSYLILDKLPAEYDPRVKAMEVGPAQGVWHICNLVS